MHHRPTTSTAALAALAACVAAAPAVPPHPDQIHFPPLAFEPPDVGDFRQTIRTEAGEVAVYLAPTHEFPLISVTFSFQGGDDLDPAGRVGLVGATASLMRRGGTTTMTPEQLDEELDFLAAQAGVRAGGTRTTASLNCLASNFDESFALFMDMVRHPGFDTGRLALLKEEQLEGMKQRNDHPQSIVRREWGYLIYGEDHFESAQATAAMVQAVTPDDMRAVHGQVVHPGNLIIAATGDFEPDWMLGRLAAALSGWAAGQPVADPPKPDHRLRPGLYHVEKDIPQGRVSMGLRSITRDDPDYFAVLLMDRILGSGGFTSRIVQRVRSDEGLAYSAGSSFSPEVYYPGTWQASFQSKSPTVALALQIILAEIERIRNEPVTREELELAQNALIETFPQRFESKAGMLATFVDDEMTDRPDGYWRQYRDRVRAVTPEQIRAVARKYLRPEDMAILVVGKWDEIAPGDLEGRATMAEFFGGSVEHLPLRDPLTLRPQS